MPYDAFVSGSSVAFAKFEVDVSLLATKSKDFLLTLGRQYLLKNQPFPNIYYFSNGELSPAIDVGGVRRDFISRLFESLFKKK